MVLERSTVSVRSSVAFQSSSFDCSAGNSGVGTGGNFSSGATAAGAARRHRPKPQASLPHHWPARRAWRRGLEFRPGKDNKKGQQEDRAQHHHERKTLREGFRLARSRRPCNHSKLMNAQGNQPTSACRIGLRDRRRQGHARGKTITKRALNCGDARRTQITGRTEAPCSDERGLPQFRISRGQTFVS